MWYWKICELKYLIHEIKASSSSKQLHELIKGKRKSWRESETKNKIWPVWRIYKTDGLSARHWWIFLQDKNGNPVSKNKPLCCRPVWFSYTTGIQTHPLTSTFWLKVSQRQKNWMFCWQEKIFYTVLNQLYSLCNISISEFEFNFKWFSLTKKWRMVIVISH